MEFRHKILVGNVFEVSDLKSFVEISKIKLSDFGPRWTRSKNDVLDRKSNKKNIANILDIGQQYFQNIFKKFMLTLIPMKESNIGSTNEQYNK